MIHKLVIFGVGELAQLAHYYFSSDSDYDVAAFTVDAEYVKNSSFCGLPVVAFEDVATQYPYQEYDFFVATGYAKLNALRKEKYLAAKSLGYRLASYVSSRAYVQGQRGDNCFIFENATIQPFATIGDNVIIWSGAFIGHHTLIKSHTFIAPLAAISGDVEIGEQCFIGLNATVRDHIKVGDKCVVGAGAILLGDAEPEGVYRGPATRRSKSPSMQLRRI